MAISAFQQQALAHSETFQQACMAIMAEQAHAIRAGELDDAVNPALPDDQRSYHLRRVEFARIVLTGAGQNLGYVTSPQVLAAIILADGGWAFTVDGWEAAVLADQQYALRVQIQNHWDLFAGAYPPAT